MGSSNLITNKQLINDAVSVYTFANDIAIRSGHIGSDLLLTAVWYCVNHGNDSTLVAEPPPKSKSQNVSSTVAIPATPPNNTSRNQTSNKVAVSVGSSSLLKNANRSTLVNTVTRPSKPSAAVSINKERQTKSHKKTVDKDCDIEIIELDDDDDDDENVSSTCTSNPATNTQETNLTKDVNKKHAKAHTLCVGVTVENESGKVVVAEKENDDLFEMDCEEIDPYEELKDDNDGKSKTAEETKSNRDDAPEVEEQKNGCNIVDESMSDEDDTVTIISDFEDTDDNSKKHKKKKDKPYNCKIPKSKNTIDSPRISTRSSTRNRNTSGNEDEQDAVTTATGENHDTSHTSVDNEGPEFEPSESNNTEGMYDNVENEDGTVYSDSPMITNVQSLSQSEQSDLSDTNLFLNDNDSGSGMGAAVAPVPVTAYSSRVNKPAETVTSIAASHSKAGETNSGYQPVYSGQPGLYMTADMSRGQDAQSMSNSVMAGYSMPNPDNPVVFSRAYNPSQLAPPQSPSPLHGLHQMTNTQQMAGAQQMVGNQQIGGDQQMHRQYYMADSQQISEVQPMPGSQQMAGLVGAQYVPGTQHIEASQQMHQMGGPNLSTGYAGMGNTGMRPPQFSMPSMVPPGGQQSQMGPPATQHGQLGPPGNQLGHMGPPGTQQPHMFAPTIGQQQQQQQHSMFQQQFLEHFVQRQQQPTEDGSPPLKRRLLDHDKKWHSRPTFSQEHEKYVGATQNEYDPRKSAPPQSGWGENTNFDGGMAPPLISMETVDDDRQVPVIYAGHVQSPPQDGQGELVSPQISGAGQRGRWQRSRGRSKVRGRRQVTVEKSPTRTENDPTSSHTAGSVSRGGRGQGLSRAVFTVHKGRGTAATQRGAGASRGAVAKGGPQDTDTSKAGTTAPGYPRGRRRKRARRGR